MNATGVLSAQPVAASGAVRVGRRSMAGLGRSTVGAFHGNTRQLKARAVMGRRAAMPMGIRAEKVVGIDLGTTNSAVRPRARAPPRVSARPSLSGVSRRSTRRGIRARFLQGSGFRFGAASRSRRARTRPRSGRPPRARARRASRGIRRAIRGARRSEPSPLHPFYPLGLLLPPTADIPRILTSAAPIRPPPRRVPGRRHGGWLPHHRHELRGRSHHPLRRRLRQERRPTRRPGAPPPAQSPRRDALYPLPARRRSRKAPFFGVPTFGTRRAASRAAPRASRERAPVGGSEGRAPDDDTRARVPRPTPRPRSGSRALPRRPPPSDRSKG